MRIDNKIPVLFMFTIFIGFNKISYSQSKVNVIDSLTSDIATLNDSLHNKDITLEKLARKIKLLEGENYLSPEKREKWRKLERYMSIEEVEKLLGKPTSIDESSSSTRFWYGNGYLNFNAFKRLTDWSEPRKNRIEIIEH